MANEPTTASTASESLRATRVYAMAGLCLAAGLAIGYLLRGPQSPAPPAQPAANAEATSASGGPMGGGSGTGQEALPQMVGRPAKPAGAGAQSPHGGAMGGRRMPTLEEMTQMADRQAAPLKEKLKSDPNNSAVLMQVGAVYFTTHQFKESSAYYGKAVQIDPKNVAFRVKLASSLYSSGDADGAIAQLNQGLSYEPNDANSLFDLGMIKLKGKRDSQGALVAWQQLLKANPQLSADRKATVVKLMADVLTMQGDQHGIESRKQ